MSAGDLGAADAGDAWQRGQAALAAGDTASALRWLDRAARLAPDDLTVALGLAACCLGRDNGRAASLFARVARESDVREAWSGLAAARLHQNDPAGAARAMGRALSRHAGSDALDPAAAVIARAAGAPGWAALSAGGVLRIRLSGAAGSVTIALDGERLGGVDPSLPVRLPRSWMTARRLDVRSGGRALIGSPFDLAAIRRADGCVAADPDGGLSGWAWHPGDPDADPVLAIRPAGRPRSGFCVRATEAASPSVAAGVLMRPRRFHVPAAALVGLAGPLRIIGQDGRDLLGSPLDPRLELGPAPNGSARVPRPASPGPRRRGSRWSCRSTAAAAWCWTAWHRSSTRSRRTFG